MQRTIILVLRQPRSGFQVKLHNEINGKKNYTQVDIVNTYLC